MASNEILDSWEDFKDFEAPPKRVPAAVDAASRGEESYPRPLGVVVTEDTHRTRYQPQIRILKREAQSTAAAPTSNGVVVVGNVNGGAADADASPPNNGAGQQKPSKTLAQREAEYAEARRRILGSDYDNGEEESAPLTAVTLAQPTAGLVPPFPPPVQRLMQQPPPAVPSLVKLVPPFPPPPPPLVIATLPPPNVPASLPPAGQPPLPPGQPLLPPTQPLAPNRGMSQHFDDCRRGLAQRMAGVRLTDADHVLRQPNGPDGTRGFGAQRLELTQQQQLQQQQLQQRPHHHVNPDQR